MCVFSTMGSVAIHSKMHWDVHHHGLWLQLMTPSCPILGDHFDIGHLIQKATTNNAPYTLMGQVVCLPTGLAAGSHVYSGINAQYVEQHMVLPHVSGDGQGQVTTWTV